MSESNINTIAMGVLLVAAGTLGVNILSGELFKPAKPEKPGYAVAVSTANASTGAAATQAEPSKPIGELLASADAAKGANVFKQCASCHTVEKGGPNRVGPNLWGVIERAKASVAGFNYSAASKGKSSEKWSFDNINAFLENPKGYLAGTTMSYPGLKKASDRADLLAYLREQADTKVDLPK